MNSPRLIESLRGAQTPPRPLALTEVEDVDRTGDAILSLLQDAADAAQKDRDRAIKLAQDLSRQLRAAEERVNALQSRLEQLEIEARKAEDWFSQIRDKISDEFFEPRESWNMPK